MSDTAPRQESVGPSSKRSRSRLPFTRKDSQFQPRLTILEKASAVEGFWNTHTLNFLLIQTRTRGWVVKELLEIIAKALVDHPEEVEVRSVEGRTVTILELHVHPEDVGQVIGHHGRIAEALRPIFGAAGMKLHKRVSVEILD